MRDHKNWSISLGCWSGVYVRLHMFFILFVAASLYLHWLDKERTADLSLNWIVWSSLLVLLVSVLLHEIGHLIAAFRLGGTTEEIVLWPLGGLATCRLPKEPQAELAVALAGPLLNLVVCGVICFPLLIFQTDRDTLVGLLNPLLPELLTTGSSPWLTVLKLTFWINWLLFLVNMLPTYPFDGGRALRAAILMFWSSLDSQSATNAVALLAKCCAAAMVGASILLYRQPAEGPIPTWFALLILAICIYFSAKQEEGPESDADEDEIPFGYDFSQGYTSLEKNVDGPHPPAQPGPFLRWLNQRREVRQQRQLELEAAEERRVDEILARLHEVGMAKLTTEERSLLQRVSTRLRNRQDKG